MLRFLEGFDWMPSGASTATISQLMQEDGWFLDLGSVLGGSLITGSYGYGLRLEIFYNSANPAGWSAKLPIGYHNSSFGFIGGGFNIAATGPMLGIQIGVWDAINNIPLITASFEPLGVISVYRGAGKFTGGVLLGHSEAGAYLDGVDFDFEIAFKVHSTAGEVQVKVNTGGVRASPTGPVLHLINVNTQPGANAYFDTVFFGWDRDTSRPAISFLLDNFRYFDDQGALNNTFLGTSRVQTCLTAGNGSVTDFTRSNLGLANWQNAHNQNVDDTLYLFDPTAADYNLSTIQPLVNSPVVFGIQITSFVRQDDATQRTWKNRISSGGVILDGAAYLTSQTYTGDNDIVEVDPNTGIQFTGAGVNALQVGGLIFV